MLQEKVVKCLNCIIFDQCLEKSGHVILAGPTPPPPSPPRVLLRPCCVTTCTSGMASELHPVHWLRMHTSISTRLTNVNDVHVIHVTVCIYINMDFGYMDPFDLAVFMVIICICSIDIYQRKPREFLQYIFRIRLLFSVFHPDELMNFLYHCLHNYIYLYYTLQSFHCICTCM